MKIWQRIFAVVLTTTALVACEGGDGFVVNLRINDMSENFEFVSVNSDTNPTRITYGQTGNDGISYVSMDGYGKFKDVHSNESERNDKVIGRDIKGFSKLSLSLESGKIYVTTDVLAIQSVGSTTVRLEQKETYETTAGDAEWGDILKGKAVVLTLTNEANKQSANNVTKIMQDIVPRALEQEFKAQMGKNVTADAKVTTIESTNRNILVEGRKVKITTEDIKVVMDVNIKGF